MQVAGPHGLPPTESSLHHRIAVGEGHVIMGVESDAVPLPNVLSHSPVAVLVGAIGASG